MSTGVRRGSLANASRRQGGSACGKSAHTQDRPGADDIRNFALNAIRTEPKMDGISGRRIVVTGGASGIGAATARRLVAGGANVVIFDRNGEHVDTTSRDIRCIGIKVDVSEPEAVKAAVEGAARSLRGLDGIVNAAGIGIRSSFAETSLADWRRSLDVNLTGPFLVCQFALPFLFEATAATIVNISSGAGIAPVKGRSAYAASKAGLISLGKVMALELAPNIRVNTIAPGAIDTPFIRSGLNNEQAATILTDAASRHALNRVGAPEDVADAVLFLTGSQSTFITGATLSVDGGRIFY
jgi:NAD(P)-dependent dehydrogenase (short-subunit alcohol dehydrogenase family)